MNCAYCDMQIIISDLDLEEEEVSEEDFRHYEEQDFSSRFAGSDSFLEHGSSPREDGPHFTDFSGRETEDREESRKIPYADSPDPAPHRHGYWTPVGFRTRRMRNIILAGLFYLSLISNLLTSGSGFFRSLCSAVCLFFMVSTAFLWQPLVDRLPGLKNDLVSGKKTMRIVYILIALMIYGFIS